MFGQPRCYVTTIIARIGSADIFHPQLEEKEPMRQEMAALRKEKEEATRHLSDATMEVLDLRAQLRATEAV